MSAQLKKENKDSSLADRIAKLFRGLSRAYGTYTLPKGPVTQGTKLTGNAKTIQGDVTSALWDKHLDGTQGLGIVPINDEGVCWFGAIDIDRYPVNFKEVEDQIVKFGYPLLPTRTKSSGCHLHAFGSEALTAKLFRQRLQEWAVAMGYEATIEIFPKQVELDADGTGNWINMPYFGWNTGKTDRYGIYKGKVLTLEEYCARAEEIAITEKQLEAMAPSAMQVAAPEQQDSIPAAAIDLVIKHWSKGQRHNVGLALTGFLLRCDKSDVYCESLLDAVCARTNSNHGTFRPTKIAKDLEAGKSIPGFPKLCKLIGEDDATALATALGIVVSKGDEGPQREPIELFGCSLADLRAPLREEKYLVEGMVPTEAYTLIAGALSSYKTMLMLNLLIWRATGFNLLSMPELDELPGGGPSGPTVLLTYEDTDWRIFERVKRLAQHGYQVVRDRHGTPSAEKFLADITTNLRRIPLAGKFGKTLITRPKGEVVPNMAFVDELLAAVRTFATEGVLIGLDPLRLALVGSQNDDDGADIAVNVLNHIAGAIPDSGLVVCSHTTKNGAKEPGTGYADASYSTSGSALYSQHARSNFLLARLPAEDIQKMFDQRVVSPQDVQAQRVARLTHGRLSHGAESTDQYVRMSDGVLLPIEPMKGRTAADEVDRMLPSVADAMERLTQAGMTVSQNSLTHDQELKSRVGGEKKIRLVLQMLEEQGFLQYSGDGKNKVGALTEKGRSRVAARRAAQADRCHAVPR